MNGICKMLLAIIALLFVIPFYNVNGAKVLMIPTNIPSHYLFFSQLGSKLVAEGNEVVMLKASNSGNISEPTPGVTILDYNVRQETPYITSPDLVHKLIELVRTESTYEWFRLQMSFKENMFKMWFMDCEDLFEDKELLQYNMAMGYDVAIMDPVVYGCLYAYPYKLGVPIISYSVPTSMWAFRVPTLSSQYPSVFTTYSNKMTFFQRFHSFVLDLMTVFLLLEDDTYIRRYVPEKKPVRADDLLYNSMMWFYLHDGIITYPKASMPNTINVADIMIRETKPLQSEFTNIMENSKQGVAIVSMGSCFDYVEPEVLDKLCEAFAKVDITFIWKTKSKPPCESLDNVHIFKWIPQNDLLANNSTKLLISHGGLNSLIESLSHGIPILGFPVGLDQPFNAAAIQNNQMGLYHDIFKVSAMKIVESINNVLSDKIIQQNAERARNILRSQPLDVGKRVSFWLNHVVQHGADHLRAPTRDLSVFEFLMIDVLFFCFIILLFVCIITVYCVYTVTIFTKRRLCSQVKNKTD